MKKIICGVLVSLGLASTGPVQAVGLVNFVNTATTLISVGGNPMPSRVNQEFIFGVFLAPSSTVGTPGITPPPFDINFQLAAGYTTNHPSVPGRFVPRTALDVGSVAGYNAGEVVDFVVRGWSSNLGSTWDEALNNIQLGQRAVADGKLAWYGSSTVGNDIYLGGGPIPSASLLGFASYSVPGFNLNLVPEPTVLTTLLLGAGGLVCHRSRKIKQMRDVPGLR